MSDPLIEPADLAIYLNDDKINTVRAAMMIEDAQTQCESIVSPLPVECAAVVRRVAGRGYATGTVSRLGQAQSGGSPFGGRGAIWLDDDDKADLRRIASNVSGIGTSGAFSIDILPDGYVAPRTSLYSNELEYTDGDGWAP